MSPNSGERVADYIIVQSLGSGAFGHVYKAEAPGGGYVSLKIFPAEHRSRAKQQVAITERVHHPRTPSLSASGPLDDGSYFIATTFIDGEPLSNLLESIEEPQALAVTKAIADVLCAAHRANIIHRDVKASNVVIPRSPGGFDYEGAQLLDFGVAGDILPDLHATLAGEVYGTPASMAPEQLAGQPQTTATDVYGMGALLFQMLFKRSLHEGSAHEILYKVRRGDVHVPQDPRISPAARELVSLLLRSEPSNRPADACDVLIRLRATSRLAVGPATARGAPAPRYGAWPSIVVASLVLLIIIATVWIFQIAPSTVPAAAPAKFLGRILLGLSLIAVGVGCGWGVRIWIARKRTALDKDTTRLLHGAKERKSLSDTIAIQVTELIERCKQLDEQILGATVALMIKEYDAAEASSDRQAALKNAVEILDKLMDKLAPWYVRHQNLLVFATSLVGVLTGLAQIVSTVASLGK